MSVVCCRIYDDRIECAADSVVMRGDTQKKNYVKLREINNMIIGVVGYVEEAVLFFEYCQTRRPKRNDIGDIQLFVSEFAKWKKEYTEKFDVNCHYILIFNEHAYFIDGFAVREITDYEAIGAGFDYALAALYLGHDVEKAIEVACELSIYCEKPICKIIKERRLGGLSND